MERDDLQLRCSVVGQQRERLATPLSAIAMIGIASAEAGAASGLFNMMRNLGGAIGTAALETFFTKRERFHSFIINGMCRCSSRRPRADRRPAAILPGAQSRERRQSATSQRKPAAILHGARSAGVAGAWHEAVIAVGNTIRAQATIMGHADCFTLLGVVLLAARWRRCARARALVGQHIRAYCTVATS